MFNFFLLIDFMVKYPRALSYVPWLLMILYYPTLIPFQRTKTIVRALPSDKNESSDLKRLEALKPMQNVGLALY